MKHGKGAPATPTHDDLIKVLLSQLRLLIDFFRAFVPEVLEFADFSAAEYLDKEHSRSGKRPRRAGDLLVKARWRANSKETAFLIHIRCPVLHFRRMDPRPHPASANVSALALTSR